MQIKIFKSSGQGVALVIPLQGRNEHLLVEKEGSRFGDVYPAYDENKVYLVGKTIADTVVANSHTLIYPGDRIMESSG